jgi:hypothetical protein
MAFHTTRGLTTRFVLVIACITANGGCVSSTPRPRTELTPDECVQVGTVAAASVWNTKKAFAGSGIPAYTDGTAYPEYRILVPPEYEAQAIALLRDLKKRPYPYLVADDPSR